MAWYRCDVDNQYDGVTAYRRGDYYNLSGTPPAAFFTADSTYASTQRTFVAPGVSVDQDGKVYVDGNLEAAGGTITKAGTAVISQAEADTVSTAEQAAADTVSTAEAAADTAIRDGIQAQSNVAVSLLTSDTTAAKQAKIDAVARTALPGVKATFTFEDGTHSETDTLIFQGFYYPIEIFGNASDASASTTKSVDIVSTATAPSILIKNCELVTVRYLDVECADNALANCIQIEHTGFEVRYCYLHGTAKTATNEAFQSFTSQGFIQDTIVSNTYFGVYSISNSNIVSRDVTSSGTNPTFGLGVSTGGIIAKVGSQPTGSSANENGSGSNGAIIR